MRQRVEVMKMLRDREGSEVEIADTPKSARADTACAEGMKVWERKERY